jgi:hypothetical protein
MAVAYVERSGEIVVSEQLPAGKLAIGYGPDDALWECIKACARRYHGGTTWWVPGIPEAGTDHDAARRAVRIDADESQDEPA